MQQTLIFGLVLAAEHPILPPQQCSHCKLTDTLLPGPQGPADVAVEEVHSILRQIVARTIESDDCKGLAQFSLLKREIATTAGGLLGGHAGGGTQDGADHGGGWSPAT